MTDDELDRKIKRGRAYVGGLRGENELKVGPAMSSYAIEQLISGIEAKRAEIARLRAALEWCGGSPDFNEGGQAEEGWRRLCAPLLADQGDGE